MKNIDISRFISDDFDDVLSFLDYAITVAFHNEGIGHLTDEIKEEINDKIEFMQMDINTNGVEQFFLIAKDNDNIIGTIECSLKDEFIAECTNGQLDNTVKMGTIYVHPAYQRKGIGSTMIRLMINELKNRDIEQFCMDSGFKNAQKIWTKKFGDPKYHLKDYWGDGDDHMIWLVNIADANNEHT